MLTLIKEDGSGRADANSYADAADGDAYHEGHLYATTWTAAIAANKDKALVMASRLIDAEYQFRGGKVSDTQALQWPRVLCSDPDQRSNSFVGLTGYLRSDMVPKALVDATCELARELLLVDRTAAPAGEGISSSWVDSAGTSYDKSDRRPVIPYLVQAMLAKYGALVKAKSGVVELVRV